MDKYNSQSEFDKICQLAHGFDTDVEPKKDNYNKRLASMVMATTVLLGGVAYAAHSCDLPPEGEVAIERGDF